MGHRTALATVEEFGLLDALHPGRFDPGLGRFGGRPREPRAPALAGGAAAATVVGGRTPNGLLIPPRFSIQRLLDSPRFAMQKTLLQLPHAEPQNYTAKEMRTGPYPSSSPSSRDRVTVWLREVAPSLR